MDVLFSNFINNFTKNSFFEAVAILFWALLLCILASFMSFVFFQLTKIFQKFVLSNLNNAQEFDEKTNQTPSSILYILFLTMTFVPFILIFALIPYSKGFIILNSNLSSLIFLTFLLLAFASSLFLSLFTFDTKKTDCIKNTFKGLLFFIPLSFSVLSVIVQSSSFNLNDIVVAQVFDKGFSNLFLFNNPVGFLTFLFSALFIFKYIETNKTNTWNEYFDNLFLSLITLFGVTLFLGGYLAPFDFYLANLFNFGFQLTTFLIFVEQFVWLVLKFVLLEFGLIFLYNKVKKYNFSIKKAALILSSISIINFVVISILRYFSTGSF